MKIILGLIFLLIGISPQSFSQKINIHSIKHLRQPNGGQYTLDGTTMADSRLKLLSPTNFGIGGVYSKPVNIIDGFSASNSLVSVSNFPYSDLFFFGAFDTLDNSLKQFTNSEIDSLYNWSKRGGKLIICGSAVSGSYNPTVLNSKWEFKIKNAVPSSFIPTIVGLSTDIFKGPFGVVNSADQGGSAQGYFNVLPNYVSVLARDINNHPTIIMDCTTLDLIVADVDGYTSLSHMSVGNKINNDQDKYWANTIVFMDKLQPLPQIINISNTLSLNTSYNSYQWYLDSLPVIGAVNSTYTPLDTGKYYVEVKVNGGCKVKSSSIIIDSLSSTTDTTEIPTLPIPLNDSLTISNIFTPNNDGINDVFVFTEKSMVTLNCKIYNRWGILVKELTEINEGWDGNTTGGSQCAAGVYYWIAEYKDATGVNEKKKGFVQLIR